MFPLSLVCKTYFDFDPSERSIEERKKVKRTLTIEQLDKAIKAAFRLGQKSSHSDDENF